MSAERDDNDAPTDAASSKPARRSWQRRLRGWLIDIAIIAALIFGVRSWQSRDVIDVGTEVPQLALTTIDGVPFELAALRGDVVQVRFQATWCGACNREQGAVNRLATSLADDEHLVTVFDAEALDAIRAHVAEEGIPGTVVVARPDTMRDWGVSAFPTNVWVRPDGTVASRSVGMTTRPVMRWHLDDARP